MTLPGYEEYLRENLNLVEKMSQSFTSLDERLDYTNRLLIKLLEVSSAGPRPTATPVTYSPGESPDLTDALYRLSSIVESLSGQLENAENFRVGQVLVTAAGTAEQLPEVLIPYDRQIVVKALRSNLGSVYIGNTQADAQSTRTSYPLWANEALGLYVKNADRIWVNADNTGEGVVWMVEQKSSWLGGITY